MEKETRDSSTPTTEVAFEENVKHIRVHIDRVIKTHAKLQTSRECSLALTQLQRGKMWLGKVLQSVGTENPYPNSEDPSNKIIDPQADVAQEDYHFQPEWDQVQNVKEMRVILGDPIDRVKYLPKGEHSTETLNYIQQSLFALEEAKMWYGWELDRLRSAAPDMVSDPPPATQTTTD